MRSRVVQTLETNIVPPSQIFGYKKIVLSKREIKWIPRSCTYNHHVIKDLRRFIYGEFLNNLEFCSVS